MAADARQVAKPPSEEDVPPRTTDCSTPQHTAQFYDYMYHFKNNSTPLQRTIQLYNSATLPLYNSTTLQLYIQHFISAKLHVAEGGWGCRAFPHMAADARQVAKPPSEEDVRQRCPPLAPNLVVKHF